MNKKLLIFPILVIGLAILLINSRPQQAVSSEGLTNNTSDTSLSTTSQAKNLEPQTQTFGAVTVEVTPTQLDSGKPSIFKLAINTHSVELAYDYKQIATLTDNVGNTYQSTEWTGGSSGHHLQGELIFEPIRSEAKQVTLTLSGIDNH